MALEKILIVGVAEIIKKLLPVIDENIGPLAWGVKDDLRKLKLTLETIQAAVSESEENQVNNEPNRLWLRRLKDVLYDADDVMDEYSYEYMRRDEMGRQLKHKVRDFVSYSSSNPLLFRFWIARKIRAINKTLGEIHKENERYNRPNTTPGIMVDQSTEKSNLQTQSKGDDSVVLGREDAKSVILMMMSRRSSPRISSSSGNSFQQDKPCVVSIVGMGGLGKTTLAQLIHKDSNILENFDLKAWVCVSDIFHLSNILMKMIVSIDNGIKYDGSADLEALGNQVSNRLNGRNFFLILDDLWNDNPIYWGKLTDSLVCTGAKSVTILITTRNLNVASVVGGIIYHLQRLKNDVCWSIMENIISSRDERVLTLELMADIGKDIAKRCDGLPLAGNFLGSLMASNNDERYWSSIKDDINLWNTDENKRLLSIIKLSYDNLPSPLKQCFSYCSMFPKDWEFERKTLIRLWMAEGFLQPSNVWNHNSIEDIGNKYFELLLSNSFFQDIMKDDLGDIVWCKMHDIVHDLAMSVVDLKEYGILQPKGGSLDASKFRRIQLVFGEGSSTKIPEALSRARKLRTVVALAPENCLQINNIFSFKRLRVLYQVNPMSSKICSSIPKLKHLRYLDLSGCRIDSVHDVSLNRSYNLQTLILRSCVNVSALLHKIKSLKSMSHLDLSYSDIKLLPDSIVGLTNLQTLNLNCCYKFEALPENIGLLTQLVFLDLSYTEITKLPDSITRLGKLRVLEFHFCNLDALPKQFGALTQLRCLDVEHTNIKELPESCTKTHCNLEMVKIGSDCKLPRDIQNWQKLKHFTHEKDGDIMPRGMEKLIYLETLQSYMVRKEAGDQVCTGTSMNNNGISHRSGIQELAALNSLQMLDICYLENVRGGMEDAERAKLKDKHHLRELYLRWRPTYGEDKFFNSNYEYFDNNYEFCNDMVLSEEEDDDMVLEGLRPHPNLRLLRVTGFSGLNLPNWMGSLLPNLVELNLFNCNRCTEKLPSLGLLPCLRDLSIQRMSSVKCLGRDFYYQQEEGSSNLNSITTASSLFPSLVNFKIISMKNLEEWVPTPSSSFYVDSFPLLEKLHIQGCRRLRSTPNSFPSLKKMEFWYTSGKAVSSILSASRGGCLTSLTSICIRKSPELTYFPLGLLVQNHTPNLHSLSIFNCSEFQGFSDDDLNNNNNSLNALRLWNCPVLTSLPDLRLWTSLRELTIIRCDKLEESIPYDLKTSLSFIHSLQVDFLQREKTPSLVISGQSI